MGKPPRNTVQLPFVALRCGLGIVSIGWILRAPEVVAAPLSGAPRWNLPPARGCAEGWARPRSRPTRRAHARCRERSGRPPSTEASARLPRSDPAAREPRPPSPAPLPSLDDPGPSPEGPGEAVAEPPATPPRRSRRGRRRDLAGPPHGATRDAGALMGLDARSCRDALERAGIRVTPVPRGQAPRVAQPVRLAGPIAGVTFAIPWSRAPERDPHTIWDCRLVVAMIPVAKTLAARGIREVDYVSVLRKSHSGSRHEVGLAIDIVAYRRHQERFPVRTSYVAGAVQACRRGKMPRDVWGTILCRAWREGQFHTILSPDHNRAHHDHLHLDLDEGRSSPTDPYVGLHGRSAGSLLRGRDKP